MAWSEWKKFGSGTLVLIDSDNATNASSNMNKRVLIDKTITIEKSGNYVISIAVSGQYQTHIADDILVYMNNELLEPLKDNGSYSIAFQPRNQIYNVEANVGDEINIKIYVGNNCTFTAYYDVFKIE